MTVHGQPVQAFKIKPASKKNFRKICYIVMIVPTYNAHNIFGDVETIGSLIAINTNMSSKELLDHSFLLQASDNSMLFNQKKKKKVGTLDILVAGGVFKCTTAENIASSGL